RARIRAAGSSTDDGNIVSQDFSVLVNAPTIAPVPEQVAALGLPAHFTLNTTDPAGNGLLIGILDAATLLPATDLTIGHDNSTGEVTITLAPGFSGARTLIASVRAVGTEDLPENYVTQEFNLTSPTLAAIPDQTTILGKSTSFTIGVTDPTVD